MIVPGKHLLTHLAAGEYTEEEIAALQDNPLEGVCDLRTWKVPVVLFVEVKKDDPENWFIPPFSERLENGEGVLDELHALES